MWRTFYCLFFGKLFLLGYSVQPTATVFQLVGKKICRSAIWIGSGFLTPRQLIKSINCSLLVSAIFVVLGSGRDGFAVSPPSTVWAHQIGTNTDDNGAGIALDNFGNLYATGSTSGVLGQSSFGGLDGYLSKYDLNGVLLWTRQFGSTGDDSGVKVSADPSGNIFLVGTTTGNLGAANAGGLDAFISKYDSTGIPIWTKQFGTSGDEYASQVSADSLGNAYVVGRTSGNLVGTSASNFDVFVSKYDSNGNRSWIKQFGTSTLDESFGVSADSLGNVFVVGDTEGSLDGANLGSRDIFLRKYDVNGNLVWHQQLGTALWDRSFGAVADNQGNVYFTGWTRGNLSGLNAGQYDAIVQKFDSSGHLVWSRQFGTSKYDYGFAISADALGNVYIGGSEETNLNASSQVVGGDAFLVKYS
jgi:hypothetical protein